MPKMKTKKSVTRRVKITATGKVMAFKSGKRHQNTGKSGDEIRVQNIEMTFEIRDETLSTVTMKMLLYSLRRASSFSK